MGKRLQQWIRHLTQNVEEKTSMDSTDLIIAAHEQAALSINSALQQDAAIPNSVLAVVQEIENERQAAIAQATEHRDKLSADLQQKQNWLANARYGVDVDEYRRVETEIKLLTNVLAEAEERIFEISGNRKRYHIEMVIQTVTK